MQNVGLVYIDLVKPNDIGLFNTLNALSSKQMELLSAETSLDIDETSIQIIGKDNDVMGDYIGGSFLSFVTIDPTSIHAGEIGEMFNSLLEDGKQVDISTNVEAENVFIVIRPGAIISVNDRDAIISAVKSSSHSYDIKEVIEQMMCGINVSNEVPDLQKIVSAPVVNSPSSPSVFENTGVNIEQVTLKVFQMLKDEMLKEGSELNSLIADIKANKDSLERSIVDSVLVKVNQHVTSLKEPVNNEEPKPAGIESIDGIIGDIRNGVDNNNNVEETKTTIYDKQIQLKDLMGGCENDSMLFERVMENKDKMSIDDLNNIVQFNMFDYYDSNVTTSLTSREQLMRKIKLGLN